MKSGAFDSLPTCSSLYLEIPFPTLKNRMDTSEGIE